MKTTILTDSKKSQFGCEGALKDAPLQSAFTENTSAPAIKAVFGANGWYRLQLMDASLLLL